MSDAPKQTAVYKPDVFEVSTFAQAMQIVVTPEKGTTTEERWEKETRYLVDDIGKWLSLRPQSCVLDYGCGPGRVAKGLIDKFGCRVIGVDFSKSMRLFAPEYVLSERFTIWSPEVLDKMIVKGFRADAAICLWVIQHALDPMEVIQRISRSLRAGGRLYSLNQAVRCVPTDKGWVNDGFDVKANLARMFVEEEAHQLPEQATTPQVAELSRIQILRNPGQ